MRNSGQQIISHPAKYTPVGGVLISLLSVALLASGCSGPHLQAPPPALPALSDPEYPSVPKEEQDLLGLAYIVCLQHAANELDDGRSDAYTIALAATDACDTPAEKYEESMAGGLSIEMFNGWKKDRQAHDRNFALTIVLKERALRAKRRD